LIKIIDQYSSIEGEQWKNHLGFLTDEELKNIQNPQVNSDLEKAVQVFTNNNAEEILFELLDYEEKRRENQSKVKADQSIVGIEEIVNFANFKPFDDSERSDIDISQSIVKVKGVKMTGDFAPERRTKIMVVEKEESSDQAKKVEEKIEINISNTNVEQGHVITESSFGDDANFSHQTTYQQQTEVTEVEQQTEAKIEQPHKPYSLKHLFNKKKN